MGVDRRGGFIGAFCVCPHRNVLLRKRDAGERILCRDPIKDLYRRFTYTKSRIFCGFLYAFAVRLNRRFKPCSIKKHDISADCIR